MADISKIKLPNGDEYNLKDSGAVRIDENQGYGTKYLNTHPENSPILIPFIHNDIAFLLKRGGSAVIKYNDTTVTPDISNVFDGSGSYWIINPQTVISGGVSSLTIELTLYKSFGWTNTIYIDFGSTSWRSKTVKIEVKLDSASYPNEVWSTKYENTSNNRGHVYTTFSHVPVGAENAGAGFNKIRFTFSNWQTATIFRIAQLGIYNYGSYGLRETYMSRGIDDPIYRSITPNSNNTYDLGSSSKKWANVYTTKLNNTSVPSITAGTAGTSSATSGTNTLAIPYVTYNAAGMITAAGTHTHTISVATTSSNGLMSSSDKTKLNGISSSYDSVTETLTINL